MMNLVLHTYATSSTHSLSQDEGFQFNLGPFSNQTVNVSYAVVTANYQVSPFSPPTELRVEGEIFYCYITVHKENPQAR